MSISPIVDEHYRLQPDDLGRSRIQVTIQNVSWQGIEQLHPLLHLREFPQKRLLLVGRHVQTLIDIAGSLLAQEWIGHTVLLFVEERDGEPTITLSSLTATGGRIVQGQRRTHWQERGRTFLLVLLLALIFALVFLLENSDRLWSIF